MDKTDLSSRTISFLRFPLTVGVVFIHFDLARNGFSIQDTIYGLNYPEWYFFCICLFSEVFPRVCVPLFFLVSGYLFFYRTTFSLSIYRIKLRRRAYTLLAPFLIWNLISIVFYASRKLPFLASIYPNAYKIEIHMTFNRILHTFFANFKNEGIFVIPDVIADSSKTPFPIDMPLWYIRDLMVMVLLTPFIYWFIKRMGMWFVVIVGLFWYLYEPLFMKDGGWCVLLSCALFFFSLGSYFSINKVSFVDVMCNLRYVSFLYIPIAFIDTITKSDYYNVYIHNVGILFGILFVVVLASTLVERGSRMALGGVDMVCKLGGSSFFVYALHIIIIDDIGKFIFRVFMLPDKPYAMIALYVITPLITTVIGVALYRTLMQLYPSLCKLLSGGR